MLPLSNGSLSFMRYLLAPSTSVAAIPATIMIGQSSGHRRHSFRPPTFGVREAEEGGHGEGAHHEGVKKDREDQEKGRLIKTKGREVKN